MPNRECKYQTDDQLIEAIQQKDQAAFNVLYDTYSAPLLGMILGVTQDLKLSEDILQKTFILTWQNINDHRRSNQRFFTWMLCIARNLANASQRLAQSNTDPKIHNSPDSVSDNTVLTMICLKGYSIEKTAKELNLSEQEVRILFKNELHHYKTVIS